MTEIKYYECEECGFRDPQDDPNMQVQIKQCAVCDGDYCENCWVDHSQMETGLL